MKLDLLKFVKYSDNKTMEVIKEPTQEPKFLIQAQCFSCDHLGIVCGPNGSRAYIREAHSNLPIEQVQSILHF